jgi:hypothetical protein
MSSLKTNKQNNMSADPNSAANIEPHHLQSLTNWANSLVKLCLAYGEFLPELTRGSKLVIIDAGKPTIVKVERVEIAARNLALIGGTEVIFFPLEPETPLQVAVTPLRQLVISHSVGTVEFQLTSSYDEIKERFGKMVFEMYPDREVDRNILLQNSNTLVSSMFTNAERLKEFAKNACVFFPDRKTNKFALVEDCDIVSQFLVLQIQFFGSEEKETVCFPTITAGRKVELSRARQLIISQMIGNEEIQLTMLSDHAFKYYYGR